jgi:7-carboxy-7-deazaguanine synthase
MLWENLEFLKPSDEVKFVVCSPEDFEWSANQIREKQLDQRFQVLISPVADMAQKHVVAERLLASGLRARFQVQLHKILWGNEAGR